MSIVSVVDIETTWDGYGRVYGQHTRNVNIALSICRIRFTVVRVRRATHVIITPALRVRAPRWCCGRATPRRLSDAAWCPPAARLS